VGGRKRHLDQPQVTRFQATTAQFQDMGLGHRIGEKTQPQVRSGKTYYRGWIISEPTTVTNRTY
jgi:hypothetical protein